MSKMEVFLEESLLQRARQRRLRALRHLHLEGMMLKNIFAHDVTAEEAPPRPKRGEMFEGLARLA